MAKIFGVKELENKVRATFNSALYSNETMNKLGLLAKTRIYSTVKSGYSLFGGSRTKIQELSSGYVSYRKKYQTIYKTGDLFSPGRSNLTFTGQMLDALTYKIANTKKSFEIFVKNTLRAPTNRVSSQKTSQSLSNPKTRKKALAALQGRRATDDRRLTNSEVAERVSEKRPFLGLDQKTIERLRSEIVKELRQAIKKDGLRK